MKPSEYRRTLYALFFLDSSYVLKILKSLVSKIGMRLRQHQLEL